jgi:hypothetical protein
MEVYKHQVTSKSEVQANTPQELPHMAANSTRTSSHGSQETLMKNSGVVFPTGFAHKSLPTKFGSVSLSQTSKTLAILLNEGFSFF